MKTLNHMNDLYKCPRCYFIVQNIWELISNDAGKIRF